LDLGRTILNKRTGKPSAGLGENFRPDGIAVEDMATNPLFTTAPAVAPLGVIAVEGIGSSYK